MFVLCSSVLEYIVRLFPSKTSTSCIKLWTKIFKRFHVAWWFTSIKDNFWDLHVRSRVLLFDADFQHSRGSLRKKTPWKTCEAEKSVTKNNKIGVLSVEKQIGVPVWKTAVFFSGWLQCGGRGFWLSYLLFGILGRCAISSTFCWGWCFPLQALGHQLSAELSHYSLQLKFSKLLVVFLLKKIVLSRFRNPRKTSCYDIDEIPWETWLAGSSQKLNCLILHRPCNSSDSWIFWGETEKRCLWQDSCKAALLRCLQVVVVRYTQKAQQKHPGHLFGQKIPTL